MMPDETCVPSPSPMPVTPGTAAVLEVDHFNLWYGPSRALTGRLHGDARSGR